MEVSMRYNYRTTLAMALLGLVLMVPVAGSAQVSRDDGSAAAPASSAPAVASAREGAGGAWLCFFREKLSIVTSGIHQSWIYIDGQKRVVIKNYQYTVVPVAPGKHEIAIRADSNVRKYVLETTIGEGERQCFQVVNNKVHAVTVNIIPIADMGTTKASKLKPVSEREFLKAKAKLKEVDPVSATGGEEAAERQQSAPAQE